MRKPSLTVQIIIAMAIGILIGEIYYRTHILPEDRANFASNFKLLSDIFLRLVKMIIAPLVFSLLLTGIAKLGDFKSVGRIGLKTLLYFLGATFLALITGLTVVNVFQPGRAFHLKMPPMEPGEKSAFDIHEFFTHIFPDSVVNAMAQNQILPIIVFVLFFAVATASIGAKGKIIIDFFDAVGHVMLKVTGYVMRLAPIGVFGATCAVISQQGVAVLQGYGGIVLSFFIGLVIFVFGFLFLICLVHRISFFKLLSHITEPMLLAFTTSSSEAAMPKLIEGLERYGLSNRIVSFVLPLGYSFNLDGSIMYMIFATISIAQAYDMHISIVTQLSMTLILMITSKGMAGVPRAAIVIISSLLTTFHIPLEGLTLIILAIDWLLDMGRSCTNVIGNAVAACVISKWEGEKVE